MTGCDHCSRPGVPYTYQGIEFDGLHANRGERLCSPCLWSVADADGIKILVVDDRPTVPPYVYDSKRDADKVTIWIPAELRGIDGRDARPKRRKTRR